MTRLTPAEHDAIARLLHTMPLLNAQIPGWRSFPGWPIGATIPNAVEDVRAALDLLSGHLHRVSIRHNNEHEDLMSALSLIDTIPTPSELDDVGTCPHCEATRAALREIGAR